MRVVFMGTPTFAVPCINELIRAEDVTVCAAFTQPDKPVGRGHRMAPPPVKEAAEAAGVPVYQPATLRDPAVAELLRKLVPDAVVVVAYGKLLPEDVLNIPRLGCINVHASLLPKYRGAAPIQWSVLNGEAETGVTTMFMAKGLDTGDMILREKTAIGENETSGELYSRLSALGAPLLLKTLRLLEDGAAPRKPQADALATAAPMIDKSLSPLDWNAPATAVHNRVRGLNPWPCATAVLNGKRLKILRTAALPTATEDGAAPGTVTAVSEEGITVRCGKGSVTILELQEEGKKKLPAYLYTVGHPVRPGMFFSPPARVEKDCLSAS